MPFCVYSPYLTYSHHQDNSVALISWSACDPPVSNDTSITCGFLDVPLDYQNRSVGTVTLALAKISAPEERIGTVLMNPGTHSSFSAMRSEYPSC